MRKVITRQEQYAFGILAAHNVGVKVSMLYEAKKIIEEHYTLEPIQISWFEKSLNCAIDEVKKRSLGTQADKELNRLYEQYL